MSRQVSLLHCEDMQCLMCNPSHVHEKCQCLLPEWSQELPGTWVTSASCSAYRTRFHQSHLHTRGVANRIAATTTPPRQKGTVPLFMEPTEFCFVKSTLINLSLRSYGGQIFDSCLQEELSMGEISGSSEMLVCYHKITRCHNPEDLDLNLHRCENLNLEF